MDTRTILAGTDISPHAAVESVLRMFSVEIVFDEGVGVVVAMGSSVDGLDVPTRVQAVYIENVTVTGMSAVARLGLAVVGSPYVATVVRLEAVAIIGVSAINCAQCHDIQLGSVYAEYVPLISAVDAWHVDLANTVSLGRGTPMAHVSLERQQGPVIVRSSQLENGRRGILVHFSARTGAAWGSIVSPVAVLLTQTVIHGTSDPTMSAAGGALQVQLRAESAMVRPAASDSGPVVWINATYIAHCSLVNGHGAAVAVLTTYGPRQLVLTLPAGSAVSRSRLRLTGSTFVNNTVSPEFGRGLDVYLQAETSAAVDLGRRVISPVLEAVWETGLGRLVAQLSGSRGRDASAAYVRRSLEWPGTTINIYMAGGQCLFGWEVARSVGVVNTLSATSSTADILLADAAAGQYVCMPCRPDTHPIVVRDSVVCVPCPVGLICRGLGHVIPSPGTWISTGLVGRVTESAITYPLRLRCEDGTSACIGWLGSTVCSSETTSAAVRSSTGRVLLWLVSAIDAVTDALEIAASLAQCTGLDIVDGAIVIPANHLMSKVWTDLKACGNALTVHVPLSAADGRPTGSCATVPLDLPIQSHSQLSSPYRAFLEGNVTVEEHAARGGEWGMWLLPQGCGVGYDGPMCRSCAIGYVRSSSSGQGACKACTSTTSAAWRQAATTLFSVSIILFLTHRMVSKQNQVQGTAVVQRLALNHLQVLGTLFFVRVDCEVLISSVVGWIASVVGGSTTASDAGCLFQGRSAPSDVYITAWLYVTAGLVPLIWTAWSLIRLRRARPALPDQSNDLPDAAAGSRSSVWWSVVLPGWVATSSLMYPSMWKAMLSVLSCMTLWDRGQGRASNPELYDGSLPLSVTDPVLARVGGPFWTKPRMQLDMSQECWTGQHLTWVVTWVAPCGLLYIGLMLAAWAFALMPLRKSERERLRRAAKAHPDANLRAIHQATYGFMYSGYSTARWYWALVHMCHVLVQLSGIVLLAGTGVGASAAWAVLMCLLRLVLSVVWMPFGTAGSSETQRTQAAGYSLVHILDIISGCGLASSAASFLYLSGGDMLSDGVCEQRAWLGSVVFVVSEACVVASIVFVWWKFKRAAARS